MNPLQYAQKAILINEFSGGKGAYFERDSTALFHSTFKPFSASVFFVGLLIVTPLSLL